MKSITTTTAAPFALFMLALCSMARPAQGQVNQTERDSLAAFEIPYLVGEAQNLTTSFVNDLNGLKRNISENVKSQLFSYIYGSFEEEETASIQSDLKYDIPDATLRRRSPITLGKYTSDFETEFEVGSIEIDPQSFRFTYPENPGPLTYEMYGAYRQFLLGEEGDTLHDVAQEKLIKYVAKRDPSNRRLNLKIVSIAFLDPAKLPEFMDREELDILSQQYLKWRSEGSSMDNLQIMSNEAIEEAYEVVRKRREDKKLTFTSTVDIYMKATERGDVRSAAEQFIKAEKMQRSHPFVLSEKDNIKGGVSEEIDMIHKRTEDATKAMNYNEASRLIAHNKAMIELWQALNSRKYENTQRVLGNEDAIEAGKAGWNDDLRRVENPTYRKQMHEELKSKTAGKDCNSADDKSDFAKSLTLLAMLEMDESSSRSLKPEELLLKAITCAPSFAEPKKVLVTLYGTNADKAISVLDDLVYFEPSNPAYFLDRGHLYAAKGEKEKALQDFEHAHHNDPNNKAAWMASAELSLALNSYASAIEKLEILRAISDQPKVDILLAYAYLEKDGPNSEDAAKAVERYRIIALDRDSEAALHQVANKYKEQSIYHRKTSKQNAEAAKYYEKMLLMVGHVKAYFEEWAYAAECYYEMGNSRNHYDRALTFADLSLAQSRGKSPRASKVRGYINRERRDFNSARDNFYDLLEQQDDYASNFELAETYYQGGREYVVARVYFEKALEKMSKKASKGEEYITHLRICQCYREEGNTKESLKHCKDAIKAQSKRGEGYYEMGLTYAGSDKKGDVKKSISSFNEAQKKGYDLYKTSTGRAQAYAKLTDFKKAKEEYDQLKAKNKNDLTALDYAESARIHLLLDKLDLAASDLQQAVALNSDFRESATYGQLQGFLALKKYNSTGSSPQVMQQYLSEARDHFQQAIDREITSPDGYLGLSMYHYFSGNEDLFMGHLNSAIEYGFHNEPLEDDRSFKSFFKEKEVKRAMKSRS